MKKVRLRTLQKKIVFLVADFELLLVSGGRGGRGVWHFFGGSKLEDLPLPPNRHVRRDLARNCIQSPFTPLESTRVYIPCKVHYFVLRWKAE